MGLLNTPTAEVKVGGVAIDTENLIEAHLHLGCTREVSNFEVVVNNGNPDYNEKQYAPLPGINGGICTLYDNFEGAKAAFWSVSVADPYIITDDEDYVWCGDYGCKSDNDSGGWYFALTGAGNIKAFGIKFKIVPNPNPPPTDPSSGELFSISFTDGYEIEIYIVTGGATSPRVRIQDTEDRYTDGTTSLSSNTWYSLWVIIGIDGNTHQVLLGSNVEASITRDISEKTYQTFYLTCIQWTLGMDCRTAVDAFFYIDNWTEDIGLPYTGSLSFTKGDSVTIKLKRGSITGSTNYLFTGSLESLEYMDQAEEFQYRNIVILRGRCLGRQLFSRKYNGNLITVVGKSYQAYKRNNGEAESLMAYLIDNYTTLSHIRTTDNLGANANAAQKNVTVSDGTKFSVGALVKIYDDKSWEYNKIDSIVGNVLTMVSNLVHKYTTADNGAVGLDLIEDSNTTYTQMVYTYETIFDIIKFITDTASTSGGVIGYESRIEYDGCFAWLARGGNTEPYTLEEEVQVERYIDDASRIKNKIWVFGKEDKPYPVTVDGQDYDDSWSDLATPSVQTYLTANITSGNATITVNDVTGFAVNDEVWIMDNESGGELMVIQSINEGAKTITFTTNVSDDYTTAQEAVVFIIYDASEEIDWGWGWTEDKDAYNIIAEASVKEEGDYSVEFQITDALKTGGMFILKLRTPVDLEDYLSFKGRWHFATTKPVWVAFQFRSGACSGVEWATIVKLVSAEDQWEDFEVLVGSKNSGSYAMGASFNWSTVSMIKIQVLYEAAGTRTFYFDKVHFWGKRWGGGSNNNAIDGFAEDTTSQGTYGVQELVVISDMLLSDGECEAKAQALKAYYMDPQETIEVVSDSLDWVDEPLTPGNTVAVDLVPINKSGDYRVDSIDVHLLADYHTLTTTFTLDNTPKRMADYLYGLSRRLRELERNYKEIR